MTSTLHTGLVADKIAELYRLAEDHRANWQPGPGSWNRGGTAQERADAMEQVYMPIAPTAGKLLYAVIRAARPRAVVEFGMSFGISTLHLAAGVRDNGEGQVYTTELSTTKIAAATQTFEQAGVEDVITVLEGDARSTVATVPDPVGVVLLDGWKEMYLEVLQLLEPKLAPGAVVVADNTESSGAGSYLDYVRDPANGYVSLNFPGKHDDTMELSSWAAP